MPGFDFAAVEGDPDLWMTDEEREELEAWEMALDLE